MVSHLLFLPGRVPASHSGFKWQKTAEKKFIQSDFTSFSMQVSANLHNFRFRLPADLSNHCKHYITNFWNLFLAGF